MEPYIGQIQAFGFNFAPRGWSFCAGQLLPISQNTALFSLLGTTFGGDGRTTFGLPDLRGRSIVGVGNGPGLDSITWGEKSGHYTQTLTTQNLPAHTHLEQIGVNDQDGATSDDPKNAYLGNSGALNYNTTATSGSFLGAGNTGSTGNGLAFNSRNPFLGIYVSIALVGLFPPRS
jgi:microcystin-dependent protein